MKSFKSAMVAAIVVACSQVAYSDSFVQQGGLEIRAAQKTLQNISAGASSGPIQSSSKLATVAVKIKNIGLKDSRVAQIDYSILLDKKDQSMTGTTTNTFKVLSGTEELPPMKPAQDAAFEFGLANISTAKSASKTLTETKLHYKIIVAQDGKTVAQITSNPKFDLLASTGRDVSKGKDLELKFNEQASRKPSSTPSPSPSPVATEAQKPKPSAQPTVVQTPAASPSPSAAGANEVTVWVNTKSGIYYEPRGALLRQDCGG